MSNKVKCTCGWSWNKSDSSKKDMYVCHQCGKDNTMKDGGWLSKFEDAPEAQNGIDAYFEGRTPSTQITKPLVEGIRQNLLGYIESPLYKKRLGNYSEYNNDSNQNIINSINSIKQQERAKNLKNTKVVISPIGNYNDVYFPNQGKIKLNNIGDSSVVAHELGHSTFGRDSDYIGSDYTNYIARNAKLDPSTYSSFLNDKEIKLFNTHSNPDFFKLHKDDPHYNSKMIGSSAEESYGDLMGVRQLLYENGLTKKFGDDINKGTLKKALENKKISKDPTFQRMRSKYDLDKIIMLNNTIAQNNNNSFNNVPLAQNGIEGTMGGLTDKGFNYNGAWGGTMAMGGSIPGAVGFTYARTQSPAPSNGPYAKKTKASAQNGMEMKYWQEGLDWKPKSISRDGGWLSKYEGGGIIEDDMGQWAHPGEITKINSNQITMQGVDYPVLGISDTGDTQLMQPGEDYTFDGKSVTEYPMAQNGIKSKPIQKTGIQNFFDKGFEIGDDIKEGFQNFIETVTPEVSKEWLFKKYRPVDYPSVGTAISNLFQHGNEPIGRDAQGDLNVGEEAWSKALGRPTKEKYITPSKYKPTSAKDPNVQYYTLSNIIDQDKIIAEAKRQGWKPGAKYQIEGLTPYIKKGVMDKDQFGMIDPLQNFQISIDPEGKYVSLYDKYDFNSGLLNAQIKPFEFYDRFYPSKKTTSKKENGGWLNKYE